MALWPTGGAWRTGFDKAVIAWDAVPGKIRCQARGGQLGRFQITLPEKLLRPFPESGLGCLICAEFARQWRPLFDKAVIVLDAVTGTVTP
jgi:hypothetical protein